jgi:hypothetical protein
LLGSAFPQPTNANTKTSDRNNAINFFIQISTSKALCFFFKLAGGEQHFMLFADGKSTGDSRFSGARGV